MKVWLLWEGIYEPSLLGVFDSEQKALLEKDRLIIELHRNRDNLFVDSEEVR